MLNIKGTEYGVYANSILFSHFFYKSKSILKFKKKNIFKGDGEAWLLDGGAKESSGAGGI